MRHPQILATKSDKEKVRYVKFDSMGHHLVTGIANLTNNGVGRNHNCNYTNRLSQQRAMARARRPPMYPNLNSRLVLSNFKLHTVNRDYGAGCHVQ